MSSALRDQVLTRISEATALMLWELGAVKVNTEQPFKLTSGNYSPIYINSRLLISSPAFLDLYACGARMLCDANDVRFDVIAGGETAGIPFAAFLARTWGKPMIYVRKAAKDHGTASRIEGALPKASQVLLVEDLITDAGSKLSFIEAIQSDGSRVSDVLVVFDRLQGGAEALKSRGIRLCAVTDIQVTLGVAKDIKLLSEGDLKAVRGYLASPKAWHSQRGLAYLESSA